MNRKIEDEITLKQLALVISEHPRYTTKELAESVGISKASLHRVYGSRDDLVQVLTDLTKGVVQTIIDTINGSFPDFEKHLDEVIAIHFANVEFVYFAGSNQICESENFVDSYVSSLDVFFEKGRRAGFLNTDIPSPAMTEVFIPLFCSITDAVRRGRIGENEQLVIFKSVLLNGLRIQRANKVVE